MPAAYPLKALPGTVMTGTVSPTLGRQTPCSGDRLLSPHIELLLVAVQLVYLVVEHWAGILGTVLLACLGAYLARRNEFKSRKAAAAAKFRASVLETLTGLYPLPVAWPKNEMHIGQMLTERFPALQAAVAEYEAYVPTLRRRAFREAWMSYRLGDEGREIDQQDYWQYVPLKGTGTINGVTKEYDQTKTYKLAFKNNVERLLSFANET
jgi:hypothetical protein